MTYPLAPRERPPGQSFPFVEDENGNITGDGHQDRAAFAAAVNRYEEAHPTGADPVEADDVAHQWVTVDEGGELLTACEESTPGAVAVTTLWGQR
ncbi:hypothetical protein P5P86_11860 [Nocardioides sp. BP30]|uniref:hypothetical protein n=1 Tax=Nocardioides sp. BP30 TaxID=3036374 RepID=UPI0024687BA6|nr:hypothetical protein [Nocardioides sp. BP30]WGL50659.1 hypothetical protein P5P86_11860 [Nocardioides sp. BP30]